MLKLPKGLKKKKKKSKKDQELFTEEELEQYKREQKAKQEASVKSDAGESDAASDVEGLASTSGSINKTTNNQNTPATLEKNSVGPIAKEESQSQVQKSEEDEQWAKFKALTSGVDSILHKTQDELDRIKKESFYQKLPSAAEKKRLEEEELARKEAERLEEERRKAAELEANRDKLAEAVVELSDSEEDEIDETDDIFATDYIEAITSGEVQLAVVPDSPVFEDIEGPDPFDTEYAEKVIVGADKVKGNKKLVSLGAAVEVLSGRVDREHALALAKPKKKQRKGIKNLLLSESVDLVDSEADFEAPEPQKNLLDELVADVPEPDQPIDLSVSLHLELLKSQKPQVETNSSVEEEEKLKEPDLSEFDTLKDDEDDEFAELAAESLAKKEEVQVITEIPIAKAEVLTDIVSADWAEFASEPENQGKPARPPPPARPQAGPHIIPGAVYVSDDEDLNTDDDPFNTTYAEQVIKKTTVLEEDDDFDPRAIETASDLTSQLESFDPFDTSVVGIGASKKIESCLKTSLSDPDFDPRANEEPQPIIVKEPVSTQCSFEQARRKSSLSLNINSKTVGFLVPNSSLLESGGESSGNKKPLTPYYAPVVERVSEDPFDTSFVPEVKPTDIELKHLEEDLLKKPTLQHSLSDPDFDPRAPPKPVPAEELLAVKENIAAKVLTPAQERKILVTKPAVVDPFDTSIAADLKPGKTELKLLESELLPQIAAKTPTGVLDIQSDDQELGLGDKVLTPSKPITQIAPAEEIDPFDTSIAENLAPGATEIKLLESELIER